MELKELITKIEQWAIDRELDKKATVEAQSIKTAEEMAELIIGISKNNIDLIKDSIGDVFVTLVIGNMIDEKHDMEEMYKMTLDNLKEEITEHKSYQIIALNGIMMGILADKYEETRILYSLGNIMGNAKIYNLDFIDCVESAYNEIKDRRGVTKNGCFVKEEDL